MSEPTKEEMELALNMLTPDKCQHGGPPPGSYPDCCEPDPEAVKHVARLIHEYVEPLRCPDQDEHLSHEVMWDALERLGAALGKPSLSLYGPNIIVDEALALRACYERLEKAAHEVSKEMNRPDWGTARSAQWCRAQLRAALADAPKEE